MKKILSLVAAAALSLVMVGAQAQKMAAPKMGKMAPSTTKMQPGTAKKGVTGTSKGTVKSAPAGSTFVLTTAKGDQTVDISKAKVRNASGQFVKSDKITAGAAAEATGTWKGKTLFADSVKLTALKAEKAGGKMAGGKMTGGGASKMTGHKLPK
jgi:hypothetical protein